MVLPNKESPMNRLDTTRKNNNARPSQAGGSSIFKEKISSPFGKRPSIQSKSENQNIFFHGEKEVSKFNIKKFFKNPLPLRKEIKYHYDGYKLKKPDLEALQKDFMTKFGKRVDKKEYIKEINKIIGEEKKQNAFSPTGYKEILKLRAEERLLKEAGGLKSLIGKHKKIIPRYDWSKWMKGDKNKSELKKSFLGHFGGLADHFIKTKEEKVINEPINQTHTLNEKEKEAPSTHSDGPQLSESEVKDKSGMSKNPDSTILEDNQANIEGIDEQGDRIFPFATRKYDTGKAMSSAKEQSFSKVQISGKKSKEAVAKSLSKPKLSELKFQGKRGIEEILDKAREHNLFHPPLKSGVLSPDEVRKYEILELEKMFPRYFGGLADKTKSNKMIEELSYEIRHMEKNPKNWEKVTLEENKLKFLKDIGNIKQKEDGSAL